MTALDRDKVDELIKLADRAVKGMKEASDGKEPDAVTETNAKTFANLASIMENLITVARRDQASRSQMAAALDRIANLKVRSASELLEQKRWEKLLTEVQAIAQDAVVAPAANLSR